MKQSLFAKACARAHEGMEIAAIAAEVPERIAIYSEYGNLSFGELNHQINQVARLLIANGVKPGDPIALLCGNRPEFAVVRFTCHRLGLRLTPINWHLCAEEVAFIVEDCDAVALFADTRCSEQAKAALANNDKLQLSISIGSSISGFSFYDDAIANYSGEDIDNPCFGSLMMYTSGTTGRPKGVMRDRLDPHKAAELQEALSQVFHFQPDTGKDCALATGPLYHAGPLNLCLTTPLTAGISIVLMDKWEPEHMLQLIQQYAITHTFCVPTMFTRLLQLDQTCRDQYDIQSLRFVIHGAAPCSIECKYAMLDWFGPIIWELFAGTEGSGTMVGPTEWLEKPGTVGKSAPGQIKILDDNAHEVPSGTSGTVYLFNPKGNQFSYHKDQEKTREAVYGDYFTVGDVGYLDKDGYLFLTGRSAEIIISGGVNIYPQEIDDVIARHEAVADVACVGVPHLELGEQVKAVVQLRQGFCASANLETEIIASCGSKLAKQKWPRTIEFVNTLPRSEAGKVLRKTLRDQHWQNEHRKI